MDSDRVAVAYLYHFDHVGAQFHLAVRDAMLRDFRERRRIDAWLTKATASGGVPVNRNEVTRGFLDLESRPDVLVWVDDDMHFAADAIDRLVDGVNDERPVVGAYCFGMSFDGVDDMGTPQTTPFATVYRWHADRRSFSVWDDHPDGVVRCDGTGAALIAIHRSALETVADRYGDHWFTPIPHPERGQVSEDLSFCLRLGECGIPVHVDTNVRTGHCKPSWLT